MSRSFRLGLFVFATLVIFGSGVFLIGRKQLLFTRTYALKAEFDNVAGLNGGAEVRVGGIPQGIVQQIQLPGRPDQKVTVVMELVTPTRHVIKKDSVASIETEGLLGNKYVEVSFGSADAERVKSGDTIGSRPPLEIADLIKKTNEILDRTKDTMENAAQTTGNLKSITTRVKEGQGTMGALVNDKRIYEQAAAATAEAKAGATSFRENMQALKSNFFLRGFFRRRGYEDASEVGKYEVAQLPPGPCLRKFEYQGKQLFDKPDTAKLKNQDRLNAAGQFLEMHPFGRAVVAARSGMKGDSEKAQSLTQARALVVRDYLTRNFRLDDTRIRTKGLGKSQETGDDGEVEIRIYPAPADAAPARPRRAPAGGESSGAASSPRAGSAP